MTHAPSDKARELDTELAELVGQGTELTFYDTKMLKRFVATKQLEARLDTVISALTACPTKDHMLRLWLQQHRDTLQDELKQELK